MNDLGTLSLVASVLVLLGAATFALRILQRQTDTNINPAILDTFQRRVQAWWILFVTLAAALLLGKVVTTILFGFLAFWALREFITLTPTRPGDHRTLFWVFFLFTPLQFILVGWEKYQLYSVAIPVYGFLFIPAWIARAGDHKRFLERTAKIQAGLLICVYCLSYAPALLTLKYSNDESLPLNNTGLLLFFVVMVQLSDVLQYAWAQIPSRHVIAPTISPSRTWEGLLGGTVSTSLLGAVLWWATPFPFWLAAIMSAVIALMGFAGGLTMSAIKRDRGVQDYGTLVEGHGGVLDRIDSICFAAPVFYHLTLWLLPYLLSG
jgi:phosphatidate cytidylyltransferase